MHEETGALLPALAEARERFMDLVAEVRPQLHRYCARMTGSVFDGEDVVQDALAKAYYALGQMSAAPNLTPWLFRIAHNTAMDLLKRHERKNTELVPEVPERAEPEETGIDPELLEAALAVFVELPPVQRSAIILKDVLGHSLAATAATMGTTVGSVKAALSRARANIARTPRAALAVPHPAVSAEERATLLRYVDFFNDRNWDGLRALLGEESQLDVLERTQQCVADAGYYDRYAEITKTEDLRAEFGFVDGVAVIAVFRPPSSKPAYFMQVESAGGRVSFIRDFRYVPYIADDARFSR